MQCFALSGGYWLSLAVNHHMPARGRCLGSGHTYAVGLTWLGLVEGFAFASVFRTVLRAAGAASSGTKDACKSTARFARNLHGWD